MEKEKQAIPQDMKLPLDAVKVIMDGIATELTEFIRIDDSQRPQDVPLGQWAAQRLIDGESVRAYDTEKPIGTPGAKYWDITLEMILAGVQKYLTAGMMFLLDGDTLDAEALEPGDAIPIVSLGVFGTPPQIEGGSR